MQMPERMKEKVRTKTKQAAYGLITQPQDGIAPLVQAIDEAKERVEILIFRFDRAEIEEALIRAVGRGVVVQALIAWTNHGGERNLRQLEARLLGAGVTVSRTASDLARYHGKMLLVDRKTLYLLAFNFTSLDIDHSRSFGVVITVPRLVHEAVRLFDADSNRQPYKPAPKTLLVSPVNARAELATFIEGAEGCLDIYDPGLGDPQMIRLLEDRCRAGIKLRVIGTMKRASTLVSAAPLAQMRLHTRTIIRDGHQAFIGSQSLRAAELDGRREIGIILTDKQVVKSVARVFEEDWKLVESAGEPPMQSLGGDKLAKKVAKAMTKELPPVSEVIETVAAEMTERSVNLEGVDMEALQETIRVAVKTVVRESIQGAVAAPPVPA